MAFYDNPKEERAAIVIGISRNILEDLKAERAGKLKTYFSDEDTYIRKSAYLVTGRIYAGQPALQGCIISSLAQLLKEDYFKIRQTVINAAGEIGIRDFDAVAPFFDTGLFDPHHAPRNAVIGSVKKMGEKNPVPVLTWAKKYLHHEDKEVRREICHGIELRGRKFPGDILPMLQELEFDQTTRVKNTLVHVLGQIAYKKDCLPTVVAHLSNWKNRDLVEKAIAEIIDVHHRYRNFSALSQQEAIAYISRHYKT